MNGRKNSQRNHNEPDKDPSVPVLSGASEAPIRVSVREALWRLALTPNAAELVAMLPAGSVDSGGLVDGRALQTCAVESSADSPVVRGVRVVAVSGR